MPRHAQRRLAALIVALDDSKLTKPQTRVEASRRIVVRAQFKIDAKYAGLDGGPREPVHELRSQALAAMFRRATAFVK